MVSVPGRMRTPWRRSVRLVAAVLVGAGTALAATVAGSSTGAAAADAVEYGWWSATPGASPTDGIQVAVAATLPGVTGALPDPTAPQVPQTFAPAAVGAVRFPVAAGGITTFTMTITSSTLGSSDANAQIGANLVACAVTVPGWTPVQNGALADKPVYDCNAQASTGVLNAGATTVTFTFSALFQHPPGMIDAVIVGQAKGPLQAQLAKPSLADARVTAGEDPFGTDDPPVTEPDPVAPTTSPAPVDGPSTTTAVLPGNEIAAPLPEAAPAVVAPEAAAPRTGPQAVGRAPARPRLVREAKSAADPKRLLFAGLLVLVGGGLFWAGTQPGRAPRLIGPLAGTGPPPAVETPTLAAGVRGIGRYARARVGSPRNLR